jgi:hypothetical protein
MRSLQFPWDIEPAPAVKLPLAEVPAPKPKPKGRRARDRYMARRPQTEPDWLYHHLTISGPAETANNFAAAARGSGVIPWQLDFAAIEEDVFVRAVSQPARDRKLTVEGCRILARQFRERVEAHHARAAALVGRCLACPFDLQVLLPVPDAVLELGSAHPTALAWLAAHWGVKDRPRQVTLRAQATAGRRLPRGHTVIGYGFFTAGETPNAAIARLGQDWPALRFSLMPCPSD